MITAPINEIWLMNCLTNNHFSFFFALSLSPSIFTFFFFLFSLTLTFVTILSNHLFVATSNLLFISLPVQVGSLIIHNVNKRDSGKFLLLLLRRLNEKIFFERWVKFMQIFFLLFRVTSSLIHLLELSSYDFAYL